MHKEQKRLPFRRLYNALLSLALMAAATLIGLLFRAVGFPETNIVIVYLLAVLLMRPVDHRVRLRIGGFGAGHGRLQFLLYRALSFPAGI